MLKRVATIQYRAIQTIFRFNFTSNKPPPGFEKFKRKSKSDQDPTQKDQKPQVVSPIPKNNDDLKQDNPSEIPKQQKDKESSEQDLSEKQQESLKDDNEQEQSENKQNGKPYKVPPFKPQQQQQQQQKKQRNQSSSNNKIFNFSAVSQNPNAKYLLLGIPLLYFLYKSQIEEEESITYNEFIHNYLEKNLVGQIEIRKSQQSQTQIFGIVYTKLGKKKLQISNLNYFLEQLDEYQTTKAINEMIPVSFVNQDEAFEMSATLSKFIQFSLYSMAFIFIIQLFRSLSKSMKGMGSDALGSKGMKNNLFEQKIKIKFRDVAGLEEAKGEIREFVDFLKAPSKYTNLGARIPRGALLTGPPGTGKTLLAKACAGEAGVPFFYVSGSEFVEMYVGLGASRVRDLFKQAKQKSPSIVFIDEIDAVGKKRNSKGSRNEERENTLNQLLVEMDGFGTETNVVILAATNMKESLDSALTRPGRFDRSIEITLPDIEGRKQIFKVHLKPLKLDPSKTTEEYANRLATLTPGFSGAEIANLCNEAAILAARENKPYITSHHFEMSSERVTAGLEKKKTISESERKVIAFHESGHAIVSWFLEGGDPLLKLTIIPRSKGSLGYAQYLPNESSLQTKEELLDKICCALGGRIAEQHFFKQITTGASDDLKKVYNIANAIVTKLGMTDEIGNLGYQEDQYSKEFSKETNTIIDLEIQKIIKQCTQKTEQLIQLHEETIKNLAAKLLEKESLDLQTIIDILGERPFKAKSNYKAYLDLKKVEKQEFIEEQIQEQQQLQQQSEQQKQQQQMEQNSNEEQLKESQTQEQQTQQDEQENKK